ncbi:MAG: acyl carrier protein [Nitrospirae bacterium]|nr:acyl carrier protein [Magnetococcales bacterium]HAT50481.1 hypothetical protein [Alphaproteobacteria bacterium]
MKKTEFLKLLDQLLENKPGTLKGAELLLDIDGWDSMINLELISLADERFGLVLSVDLLGKCQSIGDIIAMMGDHVVD